MKNSKKLSAADRADFAKLDKVVSQWVDGFDAVAKALMEIKKRKLYRAAFPSFDAYCRNRFNFSRRRAFQILKGYKVKLTIQQIDPEAAAELKRPSQVDAVAHTTPRKAVDAIKLAKAGGKVTAKSLRLAAGSQTGKSETVNVLHHILQQLELLRGKASLLNQIITKATKLKAVAA